MFESCTGLHEIRRDACASFGLCIWEVPRCARCACSAIRLHEFIQAPFQDVTDKIFNPVRRGRVGTEANRNRLFKIGHPRLTGSLVQVGVAGMIVISLRKHTTILSACRFFPFGFTLQTHLVSNCSESQRQKAIASYQDTYPRGRFG